MEIQQSPSLSKYEVVRAEFFSYTNEPTITFNPARNLVYVNAACLKRLPEADYIQFLVSPEEKRLVLRPCGADELHAVRFRSAGKKSSKPRHISCEDFMTKIIKLTRWKLDERYRLLGNIVTRNNESAVMFELNSLHGEGFGVAFDEHLNNPLVKIFERDEEIYEQN